VCIALLALVGSAGAAGPLPGNSYASLAQLPDWSGAWVGVRPPTGLQGLYPKEPPLKPAALATYLANRRVVESGTPVVYDSCKRDSKAPAVVDSQTGQFSGRTGGVLDTLIEFLFTPGRVTITSDNGMIRRIYTDGRAMPKDPFASLGGVSIGHWEGQTLVVETAGLNPKALLFGVAPAGEGFTVSERIFLKDKDTLEIDVVLNAPEALTGPYRSTQLYSRNPDRDYMLQDFVLDCSRKDRSVGPGGAQQFDLTPPADLPPPPG
jgi:hypothetical protein